MTPYYDRRTSNLIQVEQLEKMIRKGTLGATIRKAEKMYDESANESETSRNDNEITKHDKDYVKSLILEGVKKKYKEFTPKDNLGTKSPMDTVTPSSGSRPGIVSPLVLKSVKSNVIDFFPNDIYKES